MTLMEQKIDALAALVLAEDEESRQIARKALQAVMRPSNTTNIPVTTDDEDIIHQFLLELGADPALLGYRYVVYGILQAAVNPSLLDNFTKGFYPTIAMKFDTTASRAERAIRNVVEKIWQNGDWDVLTRYFGLSVRNDKGQPTNSQFIARCVLVIRSRMKQ